MLHVVRIDYAGTDGLLELEISFSTLVSHAIGGHNGNGVENEASILFNPNPNLRFNESGGVADGLPCEVCARASPPIVFVRLIHHPGESVPSAQHGREKQTLT